MRRIQYGTALLVSTAMGLYAQDAVSLSRQMQQAPDKDGIYYVGPEVTAPRLIRTFAAPYPDNVRPGSVPGMTVLAMVVDAKGMPAHIQLLHTHGDAFDRAAIAAVSRSTFDPGRLAGKPVPVWIDVRVVFRADRGQAVPEAIVSERDLPAPGESQLLDKRHRPLSYTPPYVIHSVDADFADPFARHPYVQEAIVEVLVSKEGLPSDVRVVRGLGFGLDKKAEAAVWRYRFFPATRKGTPIEARREIPVDFAKF
jgi:TonB family protein